MNSTMNTSIVARTATPDRILDYAIIVAQRVPVADEHRKSELRPLYEGVVTGTIKDAHVAVRKRLPDVIASARLSADEAAKVECKVYPAPIGDQVMDAAAFIAHRALRTAEQSGLVFLSMARADAGMALHVAADGRRHVSMNDVAEMTDVAQDVVSEALTGLAEYTMAKAFPLATARAAAYARINSFLHGERHVRATTYGEDLNSMLRLSDDAAEREFEADYDEMFLRPVGKQDETTDEARREYERERRRYVHGRMIKHVAVTEALGTMTKKQARAVKVYSATGSLRATQRELGLANVSGAQRLVKKGLAAAGRAEDERIDRVLYDAQLEAIATMIVGMMINAEPAPGKGELAYTKAENVAEAAAAKAAEAPVDLPSTGYHGAAVLDFVRDGRRRLADVIAAAEARNEARIAARHEAVRRKLAAAGVAHNRAMDEARKREAARIHFEAMDECAHTMDNEALAPIVGDYLFAHGISREAFDATALARSMASVKAVRRRAFRIAIHIAADKLARQWTADEADRKRDGK